MSTTIDSLDIQIKTSAGNAAGNIDRLAALLGRLKSASEDVLLSDFSSRCRTKSEFSTKHKDHTAYREPITNAKCSNLAG